MGVPGDAVIAYLRMPPYLEAAVADGEGELGAVVVTVGFVATGVVVVGVVVVGVVTAEVVVVGGVVAGVVGEAVLLQPVITNINVKKTATGIISFLILTSSHRYFSSYLFSVGNI